jgi:hypothetical protein
MIMFKHILALLAVPLLALGQAQSPVQVYRSTHQVAYPTNFWSTNAVAMSNALAGIGFTGGGTNGTGPSPRTSSRTNNPPWTSAA